MLPLTPSIDRALEFPMDAVVQRYAEEHGLPIEIAEEHAFELKRYLALCASHPTEGFGMRGPIDDMWHTFILFTKEYADFCSQVAGRFLHHEPSENASTGSKVEQNGRSVRERYVRFLEAYEATYGDIPPRHLWPRPMRHESLAAQFDGCGCGTCYCGGGGCSCQIAIAIESTNPLPDVPATDAPEPTNPGRPAS